MSALAPAVPRPVPPALHLPPRPAPPPRPAVPWLASVVPVVGALGFWAFTGSAFALWFALLGPLIAVAGIADGARTARRQRRESTRVATEGLERTRAAVRAHHATERDELRGRHPDVAGYLSRRDHIWRAVPEREALVVIGQGAVPSELRVTSSGDAHPDDDAVVACARSLDDAPVVVPLGGGIAVVGPDPLARSVVRALVLQLLLTHAPGRLQVAAGATGEDWMRSMPHRGVRAQTRVHVLRAGEAAPDADVLLVHATPGEPLPPRCGVVLTLTGIGEARAEIGARTLDVQVEEVALGQAAMIAAELADRALTAVGDQPTDSAPVLLTDLRPSARSRARSALPVVLGRHGDEDVVVDLVRDGPHAVVTGMTGAGKSELLVSWVLALCSAYPTSDVAFLLADFKGGTAFEALASVPHVTGVITDLDERAARRAIESLRAEMRHRESVLARAGVRDIAEVDLPRLVIVVDEFAVLRDTQPELEGLFADIAARGRALGLHLLVGSQRAAGVMRDALLANCPLRISLRVADRLDSRAVIGTDDAAELPGGDAGRGVALVRRSSDTYALAMRVALSGPIDVDAAIREAGDPPRAPWLPELPALVTLDALEPDGGIALGLVDDPAHQRQTTATLSRSDRGLLVVGGPGSGRSTLVRTIAAQVPEALRVRIGPDAEQMWDVVGEFAPFASAAGTVVLIDDLDVVTTAFSDERARAFGEMLERVVREAGAAGIPVIATTQRLVGLVARIADLLPRRLVLPTAGRSEHVAAGASAATFTLCSAPGRGVWHERAVQIAVADVELPVPTTASPTWEPPEGVSGVVTARSSAGERWERSGVRLRAVDDPAEVDTPEPGGRVVLLGTAEQWLSRPRLLERLRSQGLLVVDAGYEREWRVITGDRALPPYAHAGRGRGWVFTPDGRPRRVTLDPTASALAR
jgi:DNA segregation ATPase FtsK/SpoIIIE, S-DNA-T family